MLASREGRDLCIVRRANHDHRRRLSMNATRTRIAAVTAGIAATLSIPLIARAAPQSTSGKEQMYHDMLILAQQMHDLKAQRDTDPGAAAAYDQLKSAYHAMSDQLGGDDPARMVNPLGDARLSVGQAVAEPQRDAGGIAGTLTVPSGCVSDSSLVFNGTNVNIPDVSTVTSTITMSGLSGRIWFVDSIIDIDHTFAADLDIKLTSPSGTVVTVSTDNGGVNDNVFNTLFADNSDPDGQAPYVNNNGLVTDHLYVNLTTASPLAPEEPFHAFAGEDPNGVWTLTITDDAGIDVGFLDDWDLRIITTTDPGNGITRVFGSTGGPFGLLMPDNALFTSNRTVSGLGGTICDVAVRVHLTHGSCDDLDITLTAPNGEDVTLTTDNGFANNNLFAPTTFSDAVDPGADGDRTATDAVYVNLVAKNALTPEESLATFRGLNPNGVWSLRVDDDAVGDTGTFFGWALIITTCSCDPACPSDINGDGAIDADDLVAVVLGWGACP
jgi:subtilisin-like proprotein convertase family protein